MKAYQFKVTIKETHPPIWRRVIIPAGITFNQLTLILNEVMGWSGAHLSSYIFQKLNLEFEDAPEEDFNIWSKWDILDAADYIIDQYVESVKSFTYIYDFGDYWAHQVQVEKVITDYEKNYPIVIKYKGDTPPEDCGGVWGFEEHLEIMSNPDHPEHDDHKMWQEAIGYQEYDLEYVNDTLEDMELSDEISAPMSREEVYENFFAGQPLKRINAGLKKFTRPSFEDGYDEYEDIDDFDDFDEYDDIDEHDDFNEKMLDFAINATLIQVVRSLRNNAKMSDDEIKRVLELTDDHFTMLEDLTKSIPKELLDNFLK